MTGFRGQRALAQVWCMTSEVRHLLHVGRIRAAVERITKETAAGVRDQALSLVEDGLTSPDELARVGDQI